HPEQHPSVSLDVLDRALAEKIRFVEAAGLPAAICTQFGFAAAPFGQFLDRLARLGIGNPVRIGMAGPADPKTLVTYAMRCGVGPSLRIMQRQTSLIGRLLGRGGAGGDKLLLALAKTFAERGNPPVEGIHMF